MTGPRRRGFTLLETLLALVLVALLASAATAWIGTAMASGKREAEEARWIAAAEAALRRFGDDLRTFDARSDRRGNREPRIVAEQDRCRIRTRAVLRDGEAVHSAEWVAWDIDGDGFLSRSVGDREERLLGLHSFTVHIEPAEPAADDRSHRSLPTLVRVTLEGDGPTVTRAWRLAAGEANTGAPR